MTSPLITGIEDDVSANNLTPSAPGVGGYGDGIFAWPEQAWSRFTSPLRTRYWCTGRPGTKGGWVNAIDCEPGNPSPLSAVQWLYDELGAGRESRIYVMASWYSQLIALANQHGIGDRALIQLAHYDGIPLVPAGQGIVAKQYASFATKDLSVALPSWYGSLVPQAAPAAPAAPAGPPPCISPHGVQLAGHIVAISALADGYWLAGTDGGVFSLNHPYDGSMAGHQLNKPIVDIVAHPAGGYWLIAADGGVFSFDAPFWGSAKPFAPHLVAPVMGGAAHPSGDGYWLVAGDGGVFSFGAAGYHGGMAGKRMASSVVDLVPTPSGNGYWLIGGDGAVYSFGDASYHGGANGTTQHPVVGGGCTASGQGYYLFASDGGVFSFGDAAFRGSAVAPTAEDGGWPVVSGHAARDGVGYALVTANGAVYTYGDALFEGSI